LVTVASITFMNLSAGLAAAAAAFPALIALYLLKLRRRPMRVSSTLLWMQAVQDLEVNVPLRWLKASLLLLLHLLIVALFCLAIARPAITDASGSLRRTIILIDRSASMSARDKPESPSRLEIAQTRAREIIDSLTRANQSGAVVAFASQPVILSGFTTSGPALNAAIADASPTDQPEDLGAALQLADTLISGSGEEETAEPTDIVLLTDGNIPDSARMLTTAGQLRIVSVLPTASTQAPANLGITSISARRDDADPATLRVFVRVQNAGSQPRSAALALSLNAETVQRRTIQVPEASSEGTPGEATATFELPNQAGGVVMASLPDADALSSDNSAAAVVPAVRLPRVLLVQPPATVQSEDPQGTLSPDWLLGDALKEMPLGSLTRVSASTGVPLAIDAASPPDLIVLDRVRPEPMPAIPTLSFGISASVPCVRSTLPTAKGDQNALAILSWERQHPVLRDVALDALLFTQPIGYELDQTALEASKVRATELALDAKGPAILLTEEPTPRGSVRRLTVGFELQNSSWPVSVGFPIFLANAIDFLTLKADLSAGVSFSTNQPAWFVAGDRPGLVSFTGPLELKADVPEGAAPDTRVSLGLIERAGVYAAAASGSREAIFVAVNLADAFESSLRSRSSIPIAGKEIAGTAGSLGAREIWPWLIMAAAALMAIEWFLHAAKARV